MHATAMRRTNEQRHRLWGGRWGREANDVHPYLPDLGTPAGTSAAVYPLGRPTTQDRGGY